MAQKEFNTRIQHKHDVEANWVKAKNFIPLVGEIIVYDRDDNFSYERFKIGDGVTNVNELGFVNQADWGAEKYQSGHILNRTHWDEIAFTNEILAKRHGVFYGDIYHFNQSMPYDIENGKEYCVTYNGQRYFVSFVNPMFPLGFDYYGVCVTEDFDMIYLYDESEADGLRYALWFNPKIKVSDVVLSIHEYERVIHKLPSEYLDDSIPCAEKKWIMEEQDGAQGVDEAFGNVWYIEAMCILNAGEEYTIVYNGEEYDCVAQPVNIPGVNIPEGAMGLGNWVLAGGEDTGEPFALVATPSTGFVTVKDLSNAKSVTVGVAKTTVQKLDRRSLDWKKLVKKDYLIDLQIVKVETPFSADSDYLMSDVISGKPFPDMQVMGESLPCIVQINGVEYEYIMTSDMDGYYIAPTFSFNNYPDFVFGGTSRGEYRLLAREAGEYSIAVYTNENQIPEILLPSSMKLPYYTYHEDVGKVLTISNGVPQWVSPYQVTVITNAEIDEICGGAIYAASEVEV